MLSLNNLKLLKGTSLCNCHCEIWLHKKSKAEEEKAQLLRAICCKDKIWRKSGSEFCTLLKMTPCCNADRWPDIMHPDRFFSPAFSSKLYTPPTLSLHVILDWQGPVACHLLAMFGTRACISCLRSLLLVTPLMTHSDTHVTQTTYIFIVLISSTSHSQLSQLYILNSGENQSWHFKLQEKQRGCSSFHMGDPPKNSFQSCKSDSQSLGDAKRQFESAWEVVGCLFANASLWISYSTQKKSNLYRSSRQQKKLQSIYQVEPKSNLFV